MKKFAMILSIMLNVMLASSIGADASQEPIIKEVPVETVVEKIVEVPVEKIVEVEKVVEVEKECDHAYVHDKHITANYRKTAGGDTIVEFSDYSWAIINHETKEYVFQPICMGDWDMTFDNFDDLKNAMETYFTDAEVTIQEPETKKQTKENKKLNPDNIQSIETELAKVPTAVKKLLIENGVTIELEKGLIENYEEGVYTYGIYNWEEKKITMDANDYSIEVALIHEIGHALDDILCIEVEGIWESYENKEIKYDNEHFYSEYCEYVAQGIHEYYNGTLEKNTTMYQELDTILGGIR